MQNKLTSGIPKTPDYKSLIDSIEFRLLEDFSNNFVLINKERLKKYYSKKWVKDPLHQWSRQWEYSYVFSRIQETTNFDRKLRILDAGSGVTFFPYFIKSRYSSADMYCVDYDKSLAHIYKQINVHNSEKVFFSSYDLRELPFDDNWFDIVYCVSVLEHTDNYDEIIDVFHRILQPGGKLVITFDISVDGTRDISLQKAILLIDSLIKKFNPTDKASLDLKSEILEVGIFTTHTAKEIDPNLLPWKLPSFFYRIKSLIAGKPFGLWPPLLTVYCITLTKIVPSSDYV